MFVDLFVTREEMYDKYCLQWSWVSMVLQQCPVSPLIVSRLSGSDQWCWGVPMVSTHSDHWSPAHLWVVCWGHLLSWDTLPRPCTSPLPHIPLLCLLLSWVNGVARCRCSPLLHCCSNTDKTYQPWSVSSIPSPGKQSSIRSIIRINPWLIVTILHIFTNLSCSHSHSVRDRTRGTKAEWKTAFIHTESEQWSARAPRPHPASTRTEFCCHCVTPSLTTSEKQFWSFITFQYWLTQSSDTDHLTHNQG